MAHGGERAGSASTTYALGRAGGYLLRTKRTTGQRVRSAHTPGARYLAHTLAVGDLYVALVDADRGGTIQLADFDPEPACWRHYPAPFGAQQTLKPDAYLKLMTPEYELAWFIEIDMATEALTTIKAKASRYHEYFRSGTEQAAHGVFPRVLWITPDTARAEAITETLARLPVEAHRLFATTTADAAPGFLASEARV